MVLEMTLAPARQITVEEFDQIILRPDNLGRKLQLVNGEIVEEMPKYAHATISMFLIGWLLDYLKTHPVGRLFNEFRIDLPDDELNARVPDLSLVINRNDELASLGGDDPLPFMPDLIIEIQSKGQSDRYMLDLANYYLAHGCRMVWLIYPDQQIVEWLASTERQLLTAGDTISGGELLPDFSLPVKSVFAAVSS